MKKIIVTLTLLCFCITGFSQSPDLQNKTWFVQSIFQNGVTTNIPNDPVDFPYVKMFFSSIESGFIHSQSLPFNQCQMGFTGHVSYTGSDTFDFIDISTFQITDDCVSYLIDFMNQYISFYNDYSTNTFTYTITTESNGSQTLVVSNSNGDEVTYTDTFFTPAPVELKNKTWYLQQLTVNNSNIPIPDNAELSPDELHTHFNYPTVLNFYTIVCDWLVGLQYFDETQSVFYLYEGATSLIDCNFSENNDFDTQYINNFYLNTYPGPYHYVYNSSGGNETLTVTNSNDDIAVYGTAVLSVADAKESKPLLYPNPVSSILNITDTNNSIDKVTLYNLQGKLLNEWNTEIKSIDMSKFPAGLYFIKLVTKAGVVSKKIIKQ